MNSTFVETLHQADGRYLSDQELQPLETYLHSFSARMEAYETLRDNADRLVVQSLRQLVQTHRPVGEENGAKCKRDMSYALGYVARAMLCDETTALQQDFLLWMASITHALHKTESATHAYRCLKQEIQATLPHPCAALITPYMDEVINTFSRR